MKILVVYGSPKDGLKVVAGADSAILRHGEPVFLPEDISSWASFIAPVVRISRLGTHIPESKCRAYYDSFSFFHVLKPEADTTSVPWTIFDRTFSPGAYFDVPDKAMDVDICLYSLSTRHPSPEKHFSQRLDVPSIDIDCIVCSLSRYCTFKTGDLLLFADYAVCLGQPQADTGLKVETGEGTCLDIRLK